MATMTNKRTPHKHWIIQQIIPAPADCYAVYAWWDRSVSDNHPDQRPVTCEFYRVPCFALVAACQTKYTDQMTAQPCAATGVQKVSPCVDDGGRGGYLPLLDQEAAENTAFLGLHYHDATKESAVDWEVMAGREYDRQLVKKPKPAR